MENLIECNHIYKKIGDFFLQDIHFALEPGYILGVIGSNGAGKSTLVRVLLGSYKLYNYMEDKLYPTREARSMAANRGDVTVEGFSLKRHSKDYKERVAYILNDTPFALGMTAKENGILYGSYYEDFDRKRYEELCKAYQVPYEVALKELSKGEQVKMQLAFALSYEAKLYILDEPAGNLDVKFRDTLYDVMRDLVKNGDKSVIYVTHLVEEMEALADYVLWIENGRQKCFETLEELLDEYRLYSGPKGFLQEDEGYSVVGVKNSENHREALLWSKDCTFSKEVLERSRRAELKEIMYYEKEREEEENVVKELPHKASEQYEKEVDQSC
jgi:ABC-2 type transport system ATP-binding protein